MMEWFKMQTCWGKAMDVLTDEELGRAFRKIYAFVLRREEPTGTGREEVFLAVVLEMLKRDIEKYEAAVAEEEKKKERYRERAMRAAQARWNKQEDTCMKDDKHEQEYLKHNEDLQECTKQNKQDKQKQARYIKNKNTDTEKEKEKEEDTEAESEEDIIICSEPPPAVSELPVAEIPLNDGTSFPVYRRDVDEYAALYPAIDVEQELRKIRGWCLANPTRRKTKRGVKRFINSWMSHSQDKGGSRNAVPENPFLAYALGEKEIGGSIL